MNVLPAPASRAEWLESLPRDWSPTNDEYHADTSHWGSSMIREFRENGPRWAHERFILRTIQPDPPSFAMELGTVVHLLIGEAEIAESRVTVVPVADRRTKAFQEARKNAAPGVTVFTEPEWDQAKACANAVLEPRSVAAVAARTILRDLDGVSEVSHRWTYVTGEGAELRVKCRADRLAIGLDGTLLLTDLKTSRNPGAEFARMYHNYGYHAQAALYRAGVLNLTGQIPALASVVIRNEKPFDVRLARISTEFADLGWRRIELDINRIARCYATGDWSSPWERGITELEPPGWAERDLQNDESQWEQEIA